MLAEDSDGMHAVMTGTTQAVDLIGGGVKVNALPERYLFFRRLIYARDRLAEAHLPERGQSQTTASQIGGQYLSSLCIALGALTIDRVQLGG